MFNFYIIFFIMAKKLITLIERNAESELKAYFADMPAETPLDAPEELVLLEYFPEPAVRSYINRFRFSKQAEIAFIKKAPKDMRQTYINYYGLWDETERYIVDNNMREAAADFMLLRRFWDDAYLLDHASSNILRTYVSQYVLESDELVLKLLRHENESLFCSYVAKGRFISRDVQKVVINERRYKAFEALAYRFYNKFKKKARQSCNYEAIMASLADLAFDEEQQATILLQFDRYMLEILLKTTPLAEKAQDFLFRHNFDPQWLKLHVTMLYGRGGYRFTPENEKRLFKALASRNLDDCLTTFRHRDDVALVQCASPVTVSKYMEDYWLSDDGQVAVMLRGDTALVEKLISRYTPEHGLCWQAEVELAKRYSADTLNKYIAFHSMCFEALDILKQRLPEVVKGYYELHPY